MIETESEGIGWLRWVVREGLFEEAIFRKTYSVEWMDWKEREPGDSFNYLGNNYKDLK